MILRSGFFSVPLITLVDSITFKNSGSTKGTHLLPIRPWQLSGLEVVCFHYKLVIFRVKLLIYQRVPYYYHMGGIDIR